MEDIMGVTGWFIIIMFFVLLLVTCGLILLELVDDDK